MTDRTTEETVEQAKSYIQEMGKRPFEDMTFEQFCVYRLITGLLNIINGLDK